MAGLRVAVIGTNIGSTLHVRPLRAAGFEVAALVGRDPERTASRARHFGIPIASTSAEAVIDSDIDAVVIATPPASHHPLAMAAIAAGKHVLCEKPLATDSRQAAEMLDAARSAGVVHMLQHQLRWHAANAFVRRIAREGMLGNLIQAGMEFDAPMTNQEALDVPDWWLTPETGGGWLRNYNSHGIDLVRYTLGEFAAVSGRLHADPGRGMLSDDTYMMDFVLENGLQGVMTGTCRSWDGNQRSRIIGSLGTLTQVGTADGTDALFLADREGRRQVEPPPAIHEELGAGSGAAAVPDVGLPAMAEGVYHAIHATDRSYGEQALLSRAFYRRIVDRGYTNPAVADFADGVAGLRVIEAVEQAAGKGRWIDL